VQFEVYELAGEVFLLAQARRHLSLGSLSSKYVTTLEPGDYILVDKHFNVYAMTAEQARQLKKKAKRK
jgi:hypothetical protein